VLVGSLLPLVLIYHPRFGSARSMLAASLLVVAGAFALLYVFIIGGQAWPLEIFPGYRVESTFGDGRIAAYAPSIPEVLLGMGGLGVAFLVTVVGVRVLRFLPQDDLQPAAGAAEAR
jgi:molybdopterin-containing oxidoreductase family membrane subunit